MDSNTLWHILQSEFDIIKNETDTSHHLVLEKAFNSIKLTLENFLNDMSNEFIRPENYLVLSDSQYFNELAKKRGFKIREGVIAHSGFSELTDKHDT